MTVKETPPGIQEGMFVGYLALLTLTPPQVAGVAQALGANNFVLLTCEDAAKFNLLKKVLCYGNKVVQSTLDISKLWGLFFYKFKLPKVQINLGNLDL